MNHWKQIGQMVKLNRQNRGLTQTQLGEQIGATKQFISNFEQGYKKCSVDKLVEIATALDCYLDINLTPKDGK